MCLHENMAYWPTTDLGTATLIETAQNLMPHVREEVNRNCPFLDTLDKPPPALFLLADKLFLHYKIIKKNCYKYLYRKIHIFDRS